MISRVFLLGYWVAHLVAICILTFAFRTLPDPKPAHPVYVQSFLNLIKNVAVYGKVAAARKDSSRFLVPKRWFLHFYVIGASVNIILSVQKYRSGHSIVTVILLYQLHLVRRLAESIFITRFSSATMNISHYILGISYYVAVPFTIASSEVLPSSSWLFMPAALTFLMAQIGQCRSHYILAALRPSLKDSTSYQIPRGLCFEFISCPHYTTEVVIYFSLATLCSSSLETLALACFVTIELSFSAWIQQAWYKRNFKDYPLHRCAIFPFIL
mmetsp:Transcript_32540/g.66430  ORF Transcript_32540/g.66430 Transcript_32540/m.66430 type:complete len:270 (+) Transcript_32540:169-978(+)